MNGETSRFSLGLLLVIAVLGAVAILMNFYHLGQTHFYQNAPARIAADVRQMNQTGAWLVPLTPSGVPRLESAPLYLWAAKLSTGLKTDFEPFDTRIPAAVCSVLLIFLAAFWFYQHAHRYARDDAADAPVEGFTLLAGLAVATSPVLYSVGREGTPASMFALLYLAAAYCWAESLEARRSFYAGFSPRFWLLWGYALAGIAMLVEGPLTLVLLWLPYICAARSYHLRRFSLLHFSGILLAFALGAWWPLCVGIKFPVSAGEVWRNWLLLKCFNGPFAEEILVNFLASPDASPLVFINKLLLSTLPWCFVALAMLVRVWQRKDRSPTLVYWAWTLIANMLVLAFVNHHFGGRLMLMPFIVLLAIDGLHRWNFETGWAVAWRVILRIFIILAMAAGLFFAILLSAPLWIVIFALMPLIWFAWVWHARRNDITYSRWETTVRLAGMMLAIVAAALALLLAEWEPRLNIQRDIVGYFAQVRGRLKKHSGPTYYLGDDFPGLYAFYAAKPANNSQHASNASFDFELPQLITDLRQACSAGSKSPIVLASHGVGSLLANPRIEPLALLYGNYDAPPKEAMLRYLAVTTSTQAPALQSEREPFYLGILGNSGTRNKNAREAGERLNRAAEKLHLRDILLLGNNIYGPNFFNHLNFIDSFEQPFRGPLKRGVTFHALLGHEDESYAAFQTRYSPFNMNGQRYYNRRLGGNLVEIFMLEARTLGDSDAKGIDQRAWLEKALSHSTAPWKIIALHPALFTGAQDTHTAEKLAPILMPLCDRYHTQLVVWAGGLFYERLKHPAHFPLMLNAGWTGNNIKTNFSSKPPHQTGTPNISGFVLLEFTSQTLTWRAITRRGLVVDEGKLGRIADLLSSGTLIQSQNSGRTGAPSRPQSNLAGTSAQASSSMKLSIGETSAGSRSGDLNLQTEDEPFTTDTQGLNPAADENDSTSTQ